MNFIFSVFVTVAFLSAIVIVLILHEGLHCLGIYLCHKKFEGWKIGLFSVHVEYANDGNYEDIYIISLLPSMVQPMVGVALLQFPYTYTTFLGFLCILQVVHLLPLFQDGKVAWYCLYKLHQKKLNQL